MHNLAKLMILLITLSFSTVSYGEISQNEKSSVYSMKTNNASVQDLDLANASLVLLKGDKEEMEPLEELEESINASNIDNNRMSNTSENLSTESRVFIVKPIDSANLTEEDLYNKAFSLYKRDNYTESTRLFIRFIIENPNNELVDNAIYWIGRNYYEMEDYSTAREAFYRIIKYYPNEDKAPAAYLGIIACENSLGDKKGAKKVYQNMAQKYPNAIETKQAKKGNFF